MKFCKHCDNMYYIKINESNQENLVYYCRNCGFEEPILTNSINDDKLNSDEGICVLDTQLQQSQLKFNNIINPYTKFDPTLPKMIMKCPNDECESNKSNSKNHEVIYIRYDDTNLKYIYICPKCDTKWLSKK
jgi:DNA-directed RNA polymerase subunit M/transcription elongation factor TFIIS